MRYIELVKRAGGCKLLIVGHLTNEEIYYLRQDGYRVMTKEKLV